MNKQMVTKKLRYQKPKISSKKIKISFFLSRVIWLDQFSLVGDVYAQSAPGGGGDPGGTSSWSDTTSGDCGTSATP